MTVDLRHYDPSPEKADTGPPTTKGRPIWPYILVILVAAGLYFDTNSSDKARDCPSGFDGAANDPLDSRGTEGITFTRGEQNHYFRKNQEVGEILVVTGMVRNSYSDCRSFIRLRGHLLTADGFTLADRYVYAGNVISENDLRDLPIREIYSRLSLRGGQDGLNFNINPGQVIPFMLVFDRLPDKMAEYRIDPVGSSPSNPAVEAMDWPFDPGPMATVPEDEPGQQSLDPAGSTPGEMSPEPEITDSRQIDREALKELFSDIPTSD